MWDENNRQREPLLKQYNGENDFGQQLTHDPQFKGITEKGRKWNDLFFAVIFLFMCCGIVAVSLVAFTQGHPSKLEPSYKWSHKIEGKIDFWFQDAVAQMKEDRYILLGALGLSIVLGVIWLQLLRMFTKLFIYLTLMLGILFVLAVGIYTYSLGAKRDSFSLKVTSFCIFGLTLILVAIVVFLRNRIELTAALFKECCQGIQHNPSLLPITGIMVTVFSGFTVYWVASFVYLYSIPKDTVVQVPHAPVEFDTKARNLMYFQVFGFYWVTCFISAVFQVSIAGAISTWYFSRDAQGYQSNVGSPAIRSLGRALTKSFGSLALGSLILAVVKFINLMLRIAKKKERKNKFIRIVISCVQCIFRVIHRAVRFMDKFAYIYIAMHGDSFCNSSRNCFNLISRNLFSAIVIDTLGEFVLFVGRLLGTAVCTLFTLATLHATGRAVSALTLIIVAIVSFVVFTLFSHVIGVGVDTVFVCYLEDLERNKDGALYMSPDLHKMLQHKADQSRKGHYKS